MITRKAWAKINLGLRIIRKRKDGYHDVETTLTTINLSDIITFSQIENGIQLECTGLDLPVQENICFQAADMFQKYSGVKHGVKITLIKNIPVGGGLGGGSSDAACVLKAMNELFNTNIPDERLNILAQDIGVDVPFFIKGGAAYARGRGDELKYFKLPKMSLIIYWPGYEISTKWAYEEYDKMSLTKSPDTDMINIATGKKKKIPPIFNLVNDFEKVVFKKHPDLLDVKANVLAGGAYIVSLSGSGSCLFVVVDQKIRKNIIRYLDGIGAQYFEVVTI